MGDDEGVPGPSRSALITGVSGQDGTYLAELLLGKGYVVHGMVRPTSSRRPRLERLCPSPHAPGTRLFLHAGDLSDAGSLVRVVGESAPDEVYNLGAQSHVQRGFELPAYTADVNALGALRLLEALRVLRRTGEVRVYQASTSEIYGNALAAPQDEATPFLPVSPYAVAKLHAYFATVNCREAYGMHASNGILFNHESPFRGEEFVTRKITRAVAAIVHRRQERLHLGNLDARRDWGHARDYVEGMWRIVRHPTPGDYVLATGVAHSVRAFVERAFAEAGIRIVWEGAGVDERGVDAADGTVRVVVDPRLRRPAEVVELLGDASKAHRELGWRPRVAFGALVAEMVAADLRREAGRDHGC